MDEPFRDGMGAALARIDQLAAQNRELQEEIERMRGHARTVKASTTDEHAHALADQTLRMLDQLEVLSQRRPAVTPNDEPPRAAEPHAHDERAPQNVLVATDRPLLTATVMQAPPPPPEQVRQARWIAACFLCFFFGVFVAGALFAIVGR